MGYKEDDKKRSQSLTKRHNQDDDNVGRRCMQMLPLRLSNDFKGKHGGREGANDPTSLSHVEERNIPWMFRVGVFVRSSNVLLFSDVGQGRRCPSWIVVYVLVCACVCVCDCACVCGFDCVFVWIHASSLRWLHHTFTIHDILFPTMSTIDCEL